MLLDLTPADVELIPPAGVETETRFAFFEAGGCVFELIHPTSERFIAALRPDGIRIDHVAFAVPDLDAEVARLGAAGVSPGHVTPDGPIAMPAQRMCYFGDRATDGLLLELIEPKDASAPSRRT